VKKKQSSVGENSLLTHKRDIKSNNKRTLLTVRQVYNGTIYRKKIALHIKSQHCRPCESPIEQRNRLTSEDGEFIEDVSQFRSMVGSLVYITITRPDIAYVVGVVSQFMQKPRTIHLDAAYRILRYLKGSPGYLLYYLSSNLEKILV
jgi:hypothetical protein